MLTMHKTYALDFAYILAIAIDNSYMVTYTYI